MNGRFISGIAAGALIGAAASVIMMPQMSHKTRRKADKASRRFVHTANHLINGIREYTR